MERPQNCARQRAKKPRPWYELIATVTGVPTLGFSMSSSLGSGCDKIKARLVQASANQIGNRYVAKFMQRWVVFIDTDLFGKDEVSASHLYNPTATIILASLFRHSYFPLLLPAQNMPL
jgi:hypothetical protein